MNRGNVTPQPQFAPSWQYASGPALPAGMSPPVVFAAAGAPATTLILPQAPAAVAVPSLLLLTATGAT